MSKVTLNAIWRNSKQPWIDGRPFFESCHDGWSRTNGIIQFVPAAVTRGGRALFKRSRIALLKRRRYLEVSALSPPEISWITPVLLSVVDTGRKREVVITSWSGDSIAVHRIYIYKKNLPASTQSDRVSFSSTSYQPSSAPQRCNCITQQAG